jgi:hypothetical protein
MTSEEFLIQHAVRLMLQEAAKEDVRPKPIVIPDAPRQPELLPEYDGARVLH